MRYKLLGRSGVRVSEVALGTMTFGDDWGWGADKEESRRIFDAFVVAGGNFIDTSNNYTDGSSERFVGDFIRDDREHFVVATKFSLTERRDDPNGGGNSRKNMVQSLERSLRRLRTEYVDLFWLHMWDFTTPVDEVMRGLDDLVRAGKILYIGISDSPAWIISRANTMAELRGWSRFVAMQLPYSLADRAPEREHLPLARSQDIAVTAWGLLEGGALTGKYNRDPQDDETRRYEDAGTKTKEMAELVMQIAADAGRTPAQVAINWVRQQQDKAQIIPILGARRLSQIEDNLGALEWELADEQVAALSAVSEFRPGFAMSFLTNDHVRGLLHGDTFAQIDYHRYQP